MEKQWVLLTGASSGIGYELAHEFGRNGFNMVLVARDAVALHRLENELNGSYGVETVVLPKDLMLPASAGEIFQTTEEKGLTIDILVNNAGMMVYGEFGSRNVDEIVDMININLVSLTRLTGLYLPGMKSRKQGRILNLGSTGSFAPCPYSVVYCATKAYVLSFSEGLAEELRGTGVTVTALCPGATRTQFAPRAGIENVRLFNNSKTMDAKTVAHIGYRHLMKGTRVVVPGLLNRNMTFSLRLTPRSMVSRLGGYLMSRS